MLCAGLVSLRAAPFWLQEILEAREKSKPHIWEYRTVEEASMNWWKMHSQFFKLPPKPDS